MPFNYDAATFAALVVIAIVVIYLAYNSMWMRDRVLAYEAFVGAEYTSFVSFMNSPQFACMTKSKSAEEFKACVTAASPPA